MAWPRRSLRERPAGRRQKKGTGSEPNRPSVGKTTAPRGACTLFQQAVIPRPDTRFHAWQNNVITYVNGHPADLGPAADDPPPTGSSKLSFLSVYTRTPYVVDYPAEDGGKTAHYILRWVATTGEKGPWSETASATIGAS